MSHSVVKIREVCEFVRGLTYSKGDEVEFSNNAVLRATNIDLNSNSLNLSEIRYIKDSVFVKTNKKVKVNDILICTASGSKSHLGKVAFINEQINMAFGGFMGVLRAKTNINPRYLFAFFKSDIFLKHVFNTGDGANINNLKFSQFENLEIILPSLQIQQKIVVKLDKIFAEIDKATAAAAANVKNAEALFQNYLIGIFQSENSNFVTKSIVEIGEIISGSGFPISEQGLLNEEIPFYKVSDMNLAGNENRMIFHNNSISRETAKKLGAKIIPPKSVIFPKIGGAIATNKKRVLTLPSCVDNNLMAIIPNEKLVKYEFFFHLISSIELSSFANEASLPSIKKSTVEERLVKIPLSLSEQEKVCRLLESLKNNSLSLRNGYMRKLNDFSALKQSILKQAFNGELVKAT